MIKKAIIKLLNIEEKVNTLLSNGYDRYVNYKVPYILYKTESKSREAVDYLFVKEDEHFLDAYKKRGFFRYDDVFHVVTFHLADFKKFSIMDLFAFNAAYSNANKSFDNNIYSISDAKVNTDKLQQYRKNLDEIKRHTFFGFEVLNWNQINEPNAYYSVYQPHLKDK